MRAMHSSSPLSQFTSSAFFRGAAWVYVSSSTSQGVNVCALRSTVHRLASSSERQTNSEAQTRPCMQLHAETIMHASSSTVLFLILQPLFLFSRNLTSLSYLFLSSCNSCNLLKFLKFVKACRRSVLLQIKLSSQGTRVRKRNIDCNFGSKDTTYSNFKGKRKKRCDGWRMPSLRIAACTDLI